MDLHVSGYMLNFDGLFLGAFFTVADAFKLLTEFATGKEAVELARAVHLALDRDSAGQVLEKDAVGGFVDLLATGSGTANELLQQVDFGNPKSRHPLFKGGLFFSGDRNAHA